MFAYMAGANRDYSKLTDGADALSASTICVLAWLAAIDGSIDEAEESLLDRITGQLRGSVGIELALDVARKRELSGLATALDFLRRSLPSTNRVLFLEMAIGMAIADRRLHGAENHFLRFLAELMGLSGADYDALFLKSTGRRSPAPSDPSRAQYWKRGERNHQSRARIRVGNDLRSEALATLGLLGNPTAAEVRTAYRRLALVHHPDRFASLDEAAVSAATETFVRIKAAYEVLQANA